MIGQNMTPSSGIGSFAYSEPLAALQSPDMPPALKYLATFAMTGIATIVAVAVDSSVTIPNLSLVYVIPVIVAAVAFGLVPSLGAAVLGALAYNFFLTEPRYSLTVDDPANIWAIALLFIVGCIASAVASSARRRADEAALARRQAQVIQRYGQDVAATDDERDVISLTADALEKLFQVPVVVLLFSADTVSHVESRGGAEPLDIEIEAARSSLANSQNLHAGIYPFDASRFDFWPVAAAAKRSVAIGLAFDAQERPAEPGILVEIVANVLALALERQALRARAGA